MTARLVRMVALLACMAVVGSWLTLWPVTVGIGATGRVASRTGVLAGRVLIGPMTPVHRADSPPQAAPIETFTSRAIQVRRVAGGAVVASARLRADGTYRLRLRPGSYVVDVVPGGFEKGKGPLAVTIRRGETTWAGFDIDTGIR